jgi:hypothetical protein
LLILTLQVKNYYQRQIEKGKNHELEQVATEANKRNRERGGPPPNPPMAPQVQQQQPRQRRPEPAQQLAPQPATQRPLAPSSEMAEAEAERAAAERAVAERAPTQASPYGPRANLVPLRQAAAPIPSAAAAEAPSHARPTSQDASRAPAFYTLEQRERRPEETRPAQPLDQERFTHLLSAQHAQAHDSPHGLPPQRETVDPYASRQPLAQQPPHPPGRTTQMPLAELDRGQRPAPYPTKQEAYTVKPEHYPKQETYPPKAEHTPPDLRRETSYGNERYRQAAQAAQLSPHPPPPRPYSETSRPSSVIQPTSAAPPPDSRPNPPTEKKRSNIMMMLNDDPEPTPKQQAPTQPPETRAPPTVPQHRSPATSTPMYQPPPQAAPYSRRDVVEAVRHHEPPRRPYGETSYASQAPLSHQHQPTAPLPHQTAIPPPSERRDPPSWTSSIGRSYAYEQPRYPAPAAEPVRHNYPPPAAEQPRYPAPAAASPPQQPSYLQPSRAAPRMESPPPAHRGHSRASSYTNQHPGQSLAPHPYASIAPPTSSQPQQQPPSYGHPHQSHIPPPPYSQHQQTSLPGPPPPVQPVQPPPRPGSTYMDPLRREEELRRYGSPGMRSQYGAYPPPAGPEQGYERREAYDRRDGYDRRYQERR